MTEEAARKEQVDRLSSPDAGHVAIRGGAARLGGYCVGMVFGTVASILLLRYLGVRSYGRFATVVAIVGVVGGLADVGLGLVGQRDYVVLAAPVERRNLLADLVGMRLLFTPVAAALAIGFTALAGYSGTMVVGVAIGGLGVVLTLVSQTWLIPAAASMRFVAITGAGLARDAASALAIVVLVVLGSGLLPFFAVPLVAALASCAVCLRIASRRELGARFVWTEWRPIVVKALPLGAAAVISVLYLRALLIITSLVSGGISTGLYAMSDRVVQVLVGAAGAMISAAFPILARAGGRDDDTRFAHVLQQLLDFAMFAAVFLVLVFAIAARPIVLLLGGSSYAGSAPLLRIQCFVLFGAFLGAVWLPALVAIQRQRAFIAINVTGLVTIGVVGGSLIPLFGVTGTAIAAVVGEAAIAGAGLVVLVRARPALLPRLRAVTKLIGIGAVCALFVLVPSLPAVGAAVFAAGSYVMLAWLSGAVPRGPVDALRTLRAPRR